MPTDIPYAFTDTRDGQLLRICPVCGLRIPEDTNPTGEITTDNYATHFTEKHTPQTTSVDLGAGS